MLTPEQETERKARDLAEGLGITVWITPDGRIVAQPVAGGTAIEPTPRAKPTPHGSPKEYSISGAGG